MAEEVKKKRGRPPNSAKQPQVDINEKQRNHQGCCR